MEGEKNECYGDIFFSKKVVPWKEWQEQILHFKGCIVENIVVLYGILRISKKFFKVKKDSASEEEAQDTNEQITSEQGPVKETKGPGRSHRPHFIWNSGEKINLKEQVTKEVLK